MQNELTHFQAAKIVSDPQHTSPRLDSVETRTCARISRYFRSSPIPRFQPGTLRAARCPLICRVKKRRKQRIVHRPVCSLYRGGRAAAVVTATAETEKNELLARLGAAGRHFCLLAVFPARFHDYCPPQPAPPGPPPLAGPVIIVLTFARLFPSAAPRATYPCARGFNPLPRRARVSPRLEDGFTFNLAGKKSPCVLAASFSLCPSTALLVYTSSRVPWCIAAYPGSFPTGALRFPRPRFFGSPRRPPGTSFVGPPPLSTANALMNMHADDLVSVNARLASDASEQAKTWLQIARDAEL